MRKSLFLFAAILLVLTACSNNEVMNSIPVQGDKQTSAVRSYEEALQVAEASISVLEGSTKTRTTTSRKVDMNNIKVCVAEKATGAKDTLLYVFNFENNQGFSIVSASKNTNSLLAVTEMGSYDPEKGSEIEGFNQFVDLAKKYVSNTRGGGPVIAFRDSIVYVNEYAGPYVEVTWGQEYTEGELFPNSIAGCWNIAITQIMTYYQYPTSISLTYPGADKSTQTLNWSQLKAHETEHTLISCTDTVTHKATSRFVRQVGYMNGSYSVSGSGTAVNALLIPTTLSTLGYQTQFYDDDEVTVSTLRSELDSNHLFAMMGNLWTEPAGHVWVLDGYTRTGSITYYLDRVAANLDEWEVVGSSDNTTTLLHFNWGWYGDCNGYFEAGVYNTHNATSYDNNHHPQTYDFSLLVQARSIYR